MNAESLILNHLTTHKFHLLRSKHVIFSHPDWEWVLVCIVIQVDEAVVEEEPRVAFLPIRVVHLIASLDIFESLNDKALPIICVEPSCLNRPLMVQHVCIGDKAICLNAFNIDSENTTSYHHTHLRVLLQRELAIVGHLVANSVVVLLDVTNFLRYLVLEGAAL